MSRYWKNLKKDRMLNIAYISFILFIILSIRLLKIQVISSKKYKDEVLNQRTAEIEIYPPRGTIYDRNMIPLTNRDRVPVMYIFKESLCKDEKVVEEVKRLANIDDLEIKKLIESDDKIIELLLPYGYEPKIDKNIDGIVITEKILRYNTNKFFSHVVGYVKKSENRGLSGIERSFDDVLKKNDKSNMLFIEKDNKGRIIPGGGFTYVSGEDFRRPSSVKLTVDYHIQKIVEDALDDNNMNGAVIVADVKSGDILSMASRPNIDQNNINSYLKNEKLEFYNKAVQVSYPAGSLFKTVVLLAAMEADENILNEIFYCKGYEKMNNVIIGCSKEDGHGQISLREAFYKSCNSVFIQIGKRIGSENIIKMAKKLGLGSKVDIGLLEETGGNLPEGEDLIGPSIGNISIGQGKIEVTPLQITNMMMIIANDGIKKDMSIVEGIITDDGHMVKPMKKNKDIRVLPVEHCKVVKNYMEDVVIRGTASCMDLDSIGGAGGKTGSAQAVYNNRETIHGWFSGYYPADNPKYIITVLIEEGGSGSKSAVPIFERIAKEIENKNR
jgi:penicillin-binding protein 2